MDDASALLKFLQEEAILRFFPDPAPPTPEKVERYNDHQLEHWAQFGYGHWAVTSREDGQLLGWNGLEYLPELKQTEVAFLLCGRVWGRGFATEGASAAVQFGFERWQLESIIGLVHPENVASRRVLEKTGLTCLDRLSLWGMEMLRYRSLRSDFEQSISKQR